MDFTITDLDLMRYVELQAACKLNNLSCVGKRADLIKRLTDKIAGKPDKIADRLAKCEICGLPVSAISSHRSKMDDGRTLITRQVRCSSRHRHTYPVKEII